MHIYAQRVHAGPLMDVQMLGVVILGAVPAHAHTTKDIQTLEQGSRVLNYINCHLLQLGKTCSL